MYESVFILSGQITQKSANEKIKFLHTKTLRFYILGKDIKMFRSLHPTNLKFYPNLYKRGTLNDA